MSLNFMRIVCFIFGGIIGYAISRFSESRLQSWQSFPNQSGLIIAFALMGFIFASLVFRYVLKFNEWFLKVIARSSGPKIMSGLIGGVIGLTFSFVINSYLLAALFLELPEEYYGLKVLITFSVAFVSIYIFTFLLSNVNLGFGGEGADGGAPVPKILDTNIIIDGRISDICKTSFLEGPIIIPASVLKELQKLADSSDSLKRNRGRLGLDNLNKMQEDPEISVEVYDDFSERDDEAPEVDAHLVAVAKSLGGKIVTNDYNLNKVAVLQGVEVLNINELANALKPVFLPGEELSVQIIKYGREAGQGVAYLPDGTMIVVEGGDAHIGKDVEVAVTSILQTVAGRLIFAKPQAGKTPTDSINLGTKLGDIKIAEE
jgi:uncharacterized protein YacL